MGNQNAANRVRFRAGRIKEFLPAHYSLPNWPKELRIDGLHILLGEDIAVAEINGARLEPDIPLNQLARFLNEHVQGAVGHLTFSDGGEGLEDGLLRLLDEVAVARRLHTDMLYFDGFFHLPWADVDRILDGWTLRTNTIAFDRLQLPSGVDPNELLKLPTVRESPCLTLNVRLPQLPGPPPLFDNSAMMEWLEQSDERILFLSSDCLSSGLLNFLGALKKNFQKATQVHIYSVLIHCPSIDGATGGLGVQDEKLFNRLGEMMVIEVVANPTATKGMKHSFEKLRVARVHQA